MFQHYQCQHKLILLQYEVVGQQLQPVQIVVAEEIVVEIQFFQQLLQQVVEQEELF